MSGGNTTTRYQSNQDGSMTIHFGDLCVRCPLRNQCTSSKSGRSVSVHA